MKIFIECGEEEVRLIQWALDFYSRVGCGQFKEIVRHPTFERKQEKNHAPQREPQVGDRTAQGEILEIKNGKALINGSVKDGKWNEAKEWKKLKDVQLSPDYSKYHKSNDLVCDILNIGRNILINEDMGKHGSWGIFHPEVDDSCKIGFNLIQQIRYELWKAREVKETYGGDNYPADACKIAGLPEPDFEIKVENDKKEK